MVFFNTAFLPGSLRITIENTGPAGTVIEELEMVRTFELDSVVCEDDGEEGTEGIDTEKKSDSVKDGENTFLSTILKEENEHKVRLSEDQSEQNFMAAPGALYGIHFPDRQSWVLIHKRNEIGIGAAFAVLILQLHDYIMRAPLSVTDFFGEIDVPDMKSIHIDVVVDCPFRKSDLFCMGSKDMMDRLSLEDQGSQKIIDLQQPFYIRADTFSG